MWIFIGFWVFWIIAESLTGNSNGTSGDSSEGHSCTDPFGNDIQCS